MERVVKSAAFSPQTVSTVGVIVHKNASHVGVLYRLSETDGAEMLHLAFHEDLRSEPPDPEKYVLWTRPSIEKDRGSAVAAFCRRIVKKAKHRQVPYGFSDPDDFFESDGTFILGRAKMGLTCASFVLAVFQKAGVPLARIAEWPPPTPEDIDAKRDLIRRLQSEHVPAEQISACESDMGKVRFRPLQVVGASTAHPFPSSYEHANSVARSIKALLDTMSADSAPESGTATTGDPNK